MKSTAFDELRSFCATVPLVDCHDHSGECGPKYADPIQIFITGYFASDLHSVLGDAEMAKLRDARVPWEDRWPILERGWRRACHTGYARATRKALEHFYGVKEVTLESLRSMEGRLLDLTDRQKFESILEEAKIAVRLENVWPDPKGILDGTYQLTPRGRLVIALPGFHMITSVAEIERNLAPVGRHVTCLDEYLDACRETFAICKQRGAVAFKDQSAYARSLAYGNPTRSQAQAVFNWIVSDPRRKAGYPDQAADLDDYLFHAFCRMARELDLPVQLHTGHMAGIRNEIVKTNAALLTPLLELHRDVRFDLFHANWPFAGEALFLAKNYPNVAIDFCWANIIDPVYCRRMFAQALSSVPHGKIHGYGSDYGGAADLAWAHAEIARDNIAAALADLVDEDYLGLDDARAVARMWMHDNAAEFFRL